MNLIIFGGASNEHEISIISAYQVKEYISDCHMIYLSKDYNMYLADKVTLNDFKKDKIKGLKKIWFTKNGFKTRFKYYKVDTAIILTHGNNGEDGSLKGLLNLYDINSVGCDIHQSALFMNKYISHKALKDCGYLVTDCYLLKKQDLLFENYQNKYPVIIKPNCGGSSIGVYVCHNEAEFQVNVNKAIKQSEELIVEEYLTDYEEYNVAVANGFVSNVFKVDNKGEIFSFEDKYDNELKLNSRKVSNELAFKLKTMAKQIYKDFNLKGIVRVDYLVTKDLVYVCELNTIPGALSYYMFDNFEEVITSQINKAHIDRYRNKCNLEPLEFNLLKLNKFHK